MEGQLLCQRDNGPLKLPVLLSDRFETQSGRYSCPLSLNPLLKKKITDLHTHTSIKELSIQQSNKLTEQKKYQIQNRKQQHTNTHIQKKTFKTEPNKRGKDRGSYHRTDTFQNTQ